MVAHQRSLLSPVRLSTRLALSMIGLVALTATSVALLAYRSIESAAVPRALDQIEKRVRMLATELEAPLRGSRSDVSMQGAAVKGLVRAHIAGGIDPHDGTPEARWREWIAVRFSAELAVKPNYTQYRVIGIADGGREIVRVDRSGPNGSIRVVPDAELQRKGDREYLREAIKVGAGEVYASRLDYNREHGTIQLPPVPTLRVAAPVFAPNGEPFGILVVNIDMGPAFDRIRSSRSGGAAVYVVNQAGDYLVHPQPAKEFGFERGAPHRIQDDLPDLAALLASRDTEARLVTGPAGERFGVAAVPVRLAGQTQLTVIEAVPYADIVAVAAPIRTSSLLAGALAAIAATGVALLLARSLTLPLQEITRAVEEFGRGSSIAIPKHATREIAVLGAAFERLTADLRKNTTALGREAEQYRRVFEASLDLILVADRRGAFVQVSPSCHEILGYRPEEMIGRNGDAFLVPTDLDKARREMRRVRRGQQSRNFETHFLHRSGRVVHLTWTGVWSDPVQHYFFIARDMTEARKTQDDLRESAALARGIVDTALDAFVQMDEAGRITDWNPQATSIFGWSRTKAVGSILADLIIPERNRAGHKEGIARFCASGRGSMIGRRLVVDALRSDGREFKVELSITYLRKRGGIVFNAFLRDITERLAAEEQLRQAQKMEALGQLTGGIAHDFNNILTVILGPIEILREAVADREELARIADMMDEAAQRGADLTQHLLAFARRQPLQPRRTEIGELLTELAKLLRPTLGERIEVSISPHGAIWPASVDPSQLTTALLNLALNARDAMPNGGKLTLQADNVDLQAERTAPAGEIVSGAYVMIAVADTGTGMPPAVCDRIFEPFFTTKGVGKGTGLGLSMVYGFVKQSGGHISVDSKEGDGTTFKIYLPRASEAMEEVCPEPFMGGGGNETVLVVEDDPLVRRNTVAQLRNLGYGALTAADAAEALAIAERGDAFDLLLTDVIMPGDMNGRELAVELQRRRPGTKVLFTSGYPENVLVHDGRLDAGVLLLAKPYRITDLARMIRKACGHGQGEQSQVESRVA